MKEYIQLSICQGNNSKNTLDLYKNDFYTLCLKNPNDNIGLRKKSLNFKNELIFLKSDISLTYLCSDFARFCLSFYKDNQQLLSGKPLSIIPKQPIPISEELSEYIRDFLPDYYGIRDNVK
jgi:hypothetical protein